MANNPFADPVPSAWESPRYGNAYEDEGERTNAWSNSPPPQLATTKDRRSNNAWQDKTEIEQHPMHAYPTTAESAPWSADNDRLRSPTDAYQYAGTRYNQPPSGYGNSDAYQYAGTRYAGAYSDEDINSNQVTHTDQPKAPSLSSSPPSSVTQVMTWSSLTSGRQSALRLIQLLAGVGHLGFATGASPYSNHPVPFSNKSCFYYLIVVSIVSLLWSLVMVFLFMFPRATVGQRIRPAVVLGIDGVLAALWGVGVIVELAKFQCPPGQYDHWCDFYNVGIFFGMLAFVSYLVLVGWDLIASLRRPR